MSGTYGSLWLTDKSGRRLSVWARKLGIKNAYKPEDFHITVCYSKGPPIPYIPIPTFPPMRATPIGFELFGENKNVLVLKVKCPFAEQRFKYAMSLGAKYDFPEYIPHITLSDDPGKIDISSLPLIPFSVFIDKEKVEPIDEEWTPSADKKSEAQELLDLLGSI